MMPGLPNPDARLPVSLTDPLGIEAFLHPIAVTEREKHLI
jgi:hypothetical protein